LNRTRGPQCKFHRIKLDFKFFFNRKIPWTGCTGPVDHNRAAGYGSTVDHGRRRPKGSPERRLGAAPVSESSLAVGENEAETSGVPTVCEGGWCGDGGRPATVNRNGGGLELGVGRVEARRGKIEWDEVRLGAAVLGAPFIGSEDGRGGGAVRGTAGSRGAPSRPSIHRLWEGKEGVSGE
jgi:hypothetical protein